VPEAVEGGVTGDPDPVGAEQPGEGCDRRRLDRARLEAVVDGVRQVHRRGAAEREQVAGDQGTVGHAGQGRVDRVPPPEGTELRSRQLPHPVTTRRGVEGGGRLGPRRRRRLVTVEGRIHPVVPGQRREVGDGDQGHGGGASDPDHLRALRAEAAGGVDEGADPEGEPEHEDRHRPRARAQGEGEAGLAVAHEGVHER
jgi:hypothetical protein